VVCFQLLATVENVEELVVIVTVSINDKPAVQSHNGAIVMTVDRSSSHVLVQDAAAMNECPLVCQYRHT